MRQVLTLLIATLFFASANARKYEYELMKKASIAYCKADYKTSLSALLEFRQKFHNHFLRAEVNQEIGHLYYLTSNFSAAKIELTKILEIKYVEPSDKIFKKFKCPTNYDSADFECMRLLFPNNNIHHFACIDLFEIYKQEHQLDSAFYFLNLANSKFSYDTRCGNDYDCHLHLMASRYKEFYLLKGDTTSCIKALIKIIPAIGCVSPGLIDSLITLIRKKYSPEQICIEENKAINSICKQEKTTQYDKYTWFEMTLFGQTININYLAKYWKIEDTDTLKDKMHTFYFFTLAKGKSNEKEEK